MRNITRPITSPSFDSRIGQVACWTSSLVLLVLGMLKLTTLPLTETELFFGVLLVLIASQLCVLIGLALPVCLVKSAGGEKEGRKRVGSR